MVPNECWAGIYLTSVAGTIPYQQITEPPIEEWHSTVISAKTFRVEIRESTYFQKGQTIVFHRVDE